MDKKNYLIIFILFVLAVVIGIAIGAVTFIKSNNISVKTKFLSENITNDQNLSAQTDDNPESIVKNILPESAEIYNIGGYVKDINNDKIDFQATTLQTDNKDLNSRIVSINPSTKIYLLINKSPEEYQKDMDNYQIELDKWEKNTDLNKGERPTQPHPLKEKKEGLLSDIKIGQGLMVSAKNNIKETKEFTASEILVQNFQEIVN